MNKMVFYMSPHIDNSGLTIHMPEDIYLKVNNLLEEHYEENHWEEFIKETLGRDGYSLFNTKEKPLNILFHGDIIGKANLFNNTLIVHQISFRMKNNGDLICGNGFPTLAHPKVITAHGFKQPLLFECPVGDFNDWLTGYEKTQVENFSHGLRELLNRLFRYDLFFKSYFWLRLAVYIQPDNLWPEFQNDGYLPPFSVYDEHGDQLWECLDSFGEALRIAQIHLEANPEESFTIENVYQNTVESVSRE